MVQEERIRELIYCLIDIYSRNFDWAFFRDTNGYDYRFVSFLLLHKNNEEIAMIKMIFDKNNDNLTSIEISYIKRIVDYNGQKYLSRAYRDIDRIIEAFKTNTTHLLNKDETNSFFFIDSQYLFNISLTKDGIFPLEFFTFLDNQFDKNDEAKRKLYSSLDLFQI